MSAGFDPFDDDNEFSRSWWEGLIANAPTPEWAQRFQAWRVADLLMERYYVDVGLQAILGWDAEDARGVHLASPGCVQAPRYFGYCDGVGVSTSHDLAIRVNLGLDGVELVPVCDPNPYPHDGDEPVDGYYELFTSGEVAFDEPEILGLNYDGEPGHDRCQHRDATSYAHLMFRFAVLARLHHWRRDDFDAGFIASLPGRATRRSELAGQVVLKGKSPNYSWLSHVEGSDPRVPGAPWAYVVFSSWGDGARAFRFDGVLEGGDFFDGASLLEPWRQCQSPTYIVRQYAFEHYML